MGHGEHHGAVGAGDDRDPLTGQGRYSVGIPRVNDHKGYALFLRLDQIPGRVCVVDRICRIAGPEDDNAGIEQVVAAVAIIEGTKVANSA